MSGPVWLDLQDALSVHYALLAEHGGPAGVRDVGLLESALSRPRQVAVSEPPDLYELGAAYASGIVASRPFVDGIKRTSLVLCVLFLELNGLVFAAPEADATAAMFALASGAMREAEFAAWLRDQGTAVRGPVTPAAGPAASEARAGRNSRAGRRSGRRGR